MSQLSAISGALAQDQFLQLLVTQLQNQDPLDPVSDKDFINQLAQLSSLQSLQNLDASFAEVLKLQQLTSGSELVGRTVTFTDENEQVRTGEVSAVTVADQRVSLAVTTAGGPATVGLDQVTSVA